MIPLTEVYEHNPGDHDDPKAGITWLLGLLGTLLLLVTVLAVTAIYFNLQAEMFQRQVVDAPFVEVQQLRGEQDALLAGGWVEVEVQGEPVRKYTIPIDQAMQLVIEEANAGGGGR
ncbi:MAG: hypothetical protein ACYSU7_17425 [Planctomycetota bacterium]